MTAPPGSAEDAAWSGADALEAAGGSGDTNAEDAGDGAGGRDEGESLPAKRLEYPPVRVSARGFLVFWPGFLAAVVWNLVGGIGVRAGFDRYTCSEEISIDGLD